MIAMGSAAVWTAAVWEGVNDATLLAHLPRVEAVRHLVDDDPPTFDGTGPLMAAIEGR